MARPRTDLPPRWPPLLLLSALSCTQDYPDPSRVWATSPDATRSFPVTIHAPGGLGAVDTPLTDARGEAVGVACASCHDERDGAPAIADSDGPPERFHETVTLRHGELGCESCHDEDRTRLHLADGTLLDFADALRLCAQCHGPQYRDYTHGAHGGMTGCWDLSSCGRDRNHCLDCHAAHAPAYPTFYPVFPPRDRHYGGQEHGP